MTDLFANIQSDSRGYPRWANLRNFYGAYVIQDDAGHFVMQAKMYVTSNSASNGCILRLNLGENNYACAYGKASGYGYDRESAAFVDALRNMGVDGNALREETGIQGGIGMSAIMPVLQKLWGGNLHSFYIGE